MTTTLRPDHDTTPHCDMCGAADVSLATLPVEGVDRELCEECEDCADPVRTVYCHGCGDEILSDAAIWHTGEPYCAGCDSAPAED